jgi:hypothetical protein
MSVDLPRSFVVFSHIEEVIEREKSKNKVDTATVPTSAAKTHTGVIAK